MAIKKIIKSTTLSLLPKIYNIINSSEYCEDCNLNLTPVVNSLSSPL